MRTDSVAGSRLSSKSSRLAPPARARASAARRRRWVVPPRARSGCPDERTAPRGQVQREDARIHQRTRERPSCLHPRWRGVQPAFPRVEERARAHAARGRAPGTATGGSGRPGEDSARKPRRASVGSACATVHAAIAARGGWVMQEVSTSRGASRGSSGTATVDGCRRRGPRRRRSCAAPCRCATAPAAPTGAHAPRARRVAPATPMATDTNPRATDAGRGARRAGPGAAPIPFEHRLRPPQQRRSIRGSHRRRRQRREGATPPAPHAARPATYDERSARPARPRSGAPGRRLSSQRPMTSTTWAARTVYITSNACCVRAAPRYSTGLWETERSASTNQRASSTHASVS